MLLSEGILRNDYTIFISKEKRKNELQGVFAKNFNIGVCPYDLSTKEKELLKQLPEIMSLLDNGALLQIKMDKGLIHTVIGNKKIEGPIEYLEVIGEIKQLNYYETIIDLNMSLADNRRRDRKERKKGVQIVKEYKKLYKGANSYE